MDGKKISEKYKESLKIREPNNLMREPLPK